VDQVEFVLALTAQGLKCGEIARRSGIPYATIHRWVSGGIPARSRSDPDGSRARCERCGHALNELLPSQRPSYSYLLGLYLGDGWITRHPRGVYCLHVGLDRRYPGIIRSCAHAMGRVLPSSRVAVRQKERAQLDEVSSYSRQWPCLFPQHGPGRKHLRPIVLKGWQREITREFPDQLLRGLIHSDGCRCINRIRHPKRTYAYPRYLFSNRSADIHQIFCEHCDLLGIAWRQDGPYNISVARRASVALLDEFVGPKD
jgi:hypothetical protein